MTTKLLNKYCIRNSGIELLRLSAMVGIVITHTFGHGSGLNMIWIYGLGENWNSSYNLALYSFGCTGITVFMYISGFYGIHLKRDKLFKLFLIIEFYTLVTCFFSNQSLIGKFANFLHPWDGWWFIRSYLFICFMSPIINYGIEKLHKNNFQLIVLFLIIYIYVGHFILARDEKTTDLLLAIYIIGRCSRLYPPKFLRYSRIISVISLVLILFVPIFLIQITHNPVIVNYFINNNSILGLVFAATTVITLEKFGFHSKLINWIASSSLSIYLITDSVATRNILTPWLLNNILERPIVGYLILLVICILCLIFDKVREFLFIPINKYLN